MTPADIPAGMRLKEIAGWNQTSEDWVRFLEFSPDGCFLAECENRVAGTATTIIYENRFAWIGMILVDPEFRRRGIGRALLEKAVAHLEAEAVPCIKLDATPAGKILYQRLGFEAEYEIERWVLKRDTGNARPVQRPSQDPGAALAMDREIFGADRTALLRSIAGTAPELLVLAPQDKGLAGYAFGRSGSLADHLGPWIARDAVAARQLLADFLERSQRDTIFVDVLTNNSWARALLNQRGFEFSRPLTRMHRGANIYPGQPDLVCAILGPEFG